MRKRHSTVSIGKKYEPPSTRKQSVSVQCLEIRELPDLLRHNILSLMLASTRCFRERSEKPVAGRYGIIPFLSSSFGEEYSQHAHKYRHIRAH